MLSDDIIFQCRLHDDGELPTKWIIYLKKDYQTYLGRVLLKNTKLIKKNITSKPVVFINNGVDDFLCFLCEITINMQILLKVM